MIKRDFWVPTGLNIEGSISHIIYSSDTILKVSERNPIIIFKINLKGGGGGGGGSIGITWGYGWKYGAGGGGEGEAFSITEITICQQPVIITIGEGGKGGEKGTGLGEETIGGAGGNTVLNFGTVYTLNGGLGGGIGDGIGSGGTGGSGGTVGSTPGENGGDGSSPGFYISLGGDGGGGGDGGYCSYDCKDAKNGYTSSNYGGGGGGASGYSSVLNGQWDGGNGGNGGNGFVELFFLNISKEDISIWENIISTS